MRIKALTSPENEPTFGINQNIPHNVTSLAPRHHMDRSQIEAIPPRQAPNLGFSRSQNLHLRSIPHTSIHKYENCYSEATDLKSEMLLHILHKNFSSELTLT